MRPWINATSVNQSFGSDPQRAIESVTGRLPLPAASAPCRSASRVLCFCTVRNLRRQPSPRSGDGAWKADAVSRSNRAALDALGERNMNTFVPSRESDTRQVRLTEQEALVNLRAVLELCAAGQVKCGATTSRPSTATI